MSIFNFFRRNTKVNPDIIVNPDIVVNRNLENNSTIVNLLKIEEHDFHLSRCSNQAFLDEIIGDYKYIHYLSRNSINFKPIDSNSLMYQAAYNAFKHHIPLSLSPVILWYAISHEIATYVKKNAQKYAKYFTDSPQKKIKIRIYDDNLIYGGNNDWTRVLRFFKNILSEYITSELYHILLPKFSTMTEEDEMAILVNFMDTISEYYEFEACVPCGIPRIRLEGTLSDWELLVKNTQKLRQFFGKGQLSDYFKHLLPVLETIKNTVQQGKGDLEFWKSIYKAEGGCGGPFITGWLIAFIAYCYPAEQFGLRRYFDWKIRGTYIFDDSIPPHISKVKFKWQYGEQNIPMMFISGILGVDRVDQFLTPKLGFGVIELKEG